MTDWRIAAVWAAVFTVGGAALSVLVLTTLTVLTPHPHAPKEGPTWATVPVPTRSS